MNPLRIQYIIHHPGEEGAGIRPYDEDVVIQVMSGDPGGDPGEFTEFMRDCLAQWFDGAWVSATAEEGTP